MENEGHGKGPGLPPGGLGWGQVAPAGRETPGASWRSEAQGTLDRLGWAPPSASWDRSGPGIQVKETPLLSHPGSTPGDTALLSRLLQFAFSRISCAWKLPGRSPFESGYVSLSTAVGPSIRHAAVRASSSCPFIADWCPVEWRHLLRVSPSTC